MSTLISRHITRAQKSQQHRNAACSSHVCMGHLSSSLHITHAELRHTARSPKLTCSGVAAGRGRWHWRTSPYFSWISWVMSSMMSSYSPSSTKSLRATCS